LEQGIKDSGLAEKVSSHVVSLTTRRYYSEKFVLKVQLIYGSGRLRLDKFTVPNESQ
jgi:hypothetical protein